MCPVLFMKTIEIIIQVLYLILTLYGFMWRLWVLRHCCCCFYFLLVVLQNSCKKQNLMIYVSIILLWTLHLVFCVRMCFVCTVCMDWIWMHIKTYHYSHWVSCRSVVKASRYVHSFPQQNCTWDLGLRGWTQHETLWMYGLRSWRVAHLQAQ